MNDILNESQYNLYIKCIRSMIDTIDKYKTESIKRKTILLNEKSPTSANNELKNAFSDMGSMMENEFGKREPAKPSIIDDDPFKDDDNHTNVCFICYIYIVCLPLNVLMLYNLYKYFK